MSIVVKIGSAIRYRKSDNSPPPSEKASIIGQRLAGCSRPTRTGDIETLADFELLRAPEHQRTPSVVILYLGAPSALSRESLGDWLPDDLKDLIAKHHESLANIPLTVKNPAGDPITGRQWEWVFRPRGIEIPVRLINALLTRNKRSEPPRSTPIITMEDLLVLSSKDLLRTKNLGKTTVGELIEILRQFIGGFEPGSS